jgi:ABC-type sugar transport system ATPase subunit
MSTTNGNDATPILEVRDVEKRFGATLALDSVSLTLNKGEILALLGDNGAGKSTLIKILSGVVKPDAGEIRIDGERVSIGSPHDARALGSRPSTRTSRCSTTSTRSATSTPAASP